MSIEQVEAAEALCALNARSLAQTPAVLPALQAFHLQRFANLCALVQNLPVYRLALNLTDPYWEMLQQFLSA